MQQFRLAQTDYGERHNEFATTLCAKLSVLFATAYTYTASQQATIAGNTKPSTAFTTATAMSRIFGNNNQ
jgi:hypothetical protein